MTEIEPHKVGRRLDKEFRWRGTEVSRVEAIADAVFGLVLAMLLLNEHPPEKLADLFVAMKSLIPLSLTFVFVAMVWFEHYLFFRRYDLHDGPSIALTFLLLFLTVAFAYPLKLVLTALWIGFFGPLGGLTMEKIVEGANISAVFIVYSLGYALIYVTIALLYRRALRQRGALELDEAEVFLTRSAIASSLVHVGVGLLSVALAVAGMVLGTESPLARYGIPGWIYFLIGPAMGVHGTWQGNRLRQLTAQQETTPLAQ
jgi:uncharacterized membrane protein